jgi:hypothetical protein
MSGRRWLRHPSRPNLKSQGWPRVWVSSTALVGIFSQTAGSTCKFWVNPVNFTFRVGLVEKHGLHELREGRAWPRATLSFYTAIDCHCLPFRRD